MAVTFGCPLVGTEAELSSKVLKKGQRAYATDKTLSTTTIGEGENQVTAFETAWKTGDGEKDFQSLPWDINPGGDDIGNIDLTTYLTKTEAENTYAKSDDLNNFQSKLAVSISEDNVLQIITN